MKGRVLSVLLMFALGLTTGGGYLFAVHPWNCYHWPKTNINYDGPKKDKGGKAPARSAEYEQAYNEAVALWNTTVINLSGPGGSDLDLLYKSYGFNGWLGLAQIFISGCHITDSLAKLNASYLDNSSTYSYDDICHVACQEVGHTFGLEHNRGSNTTCMNDTVLIGCVINQHDKDQLASIYAHTPD